MRDSRADGSSDPEEEEAVEAVDEAAGVNGARFGSGPTRPRREDMAAAAPFVFNRRCSAKCTFVQFKIQFKVKQSLF
jgi:hypothetical protein